MSFACEGRLGYRPCGIPFFKYPGPVKIRNVSKLLDRSMPFTVKLEGLDEYETKPYGHSYVYECIIVLWINSWQRNVNGSQQKHDSIESASMFGFFANIDLLLPLCLKSLTLRIATPDIVDATENIEVTVPSLLDAKHIEVFLLLMDVLAFGSMRSALKNYENTLNSKIGNCIPICDEVCDFLTGISSIIHFSQSALLIERYLTTLYIAEFDGKESLRFDTSVSTGWRRFLNHFGNRKPIPISADMNISKIRRAHCSRRLRLRTVEKLATIPAFVAINFPLQYPIRGKRQKPLHSSWTHQVLDADDDGISCPFEDGFDRLPRSHWLAEILVYEASNECVIEFTFVRYFNSYVN